MKKKLHSAQSNTIKEMDAPFIWKKDPLTSPKCESAHCPFVSGLAMATLTPGNNCKNNKISMKNNFTS